MPRKTNVVLTTTKEEINKINPDNKELMEDFLNYLETTVKSPTTILVYRNNLEIFFIYLMKFCKNKDFVDIKKRDIMNWQNYLIKNGLSSARIKVLRSTVSSMSNFIETILDEEEKWENFKNIVNKIPAPTSAPVREKTILTDDDYQGLLDTLVEQKKYQHACALALAWASGRRKSELVRIKKSYITEENLKYGSLYKTPEKIKTKGRGNGKFLYVFILKSKFKVYFDLWMEERKRLGVPDEIDEIFVTFRNGKWGAAELSLLSSYALKFSKMLGVDFYFHSARHQYTTSLSEAGIPDDIIKQIVGWESSDMVSLYKDTDIDDELEKYFTEDGIKSVEAKGLSDL